MSKRRPRGTGFVRERGGGRQLVVTIGGKQYSRAVETRTLREARDMLPAFITEVRSGAVAAAKVAAARAKEAPTFSTLTQDYLRLHVRPDADGEATRRAYGYAFSVIGQEIGDRKLTDITEDELHRQFRGLSERLAYASVQSVHRALSAFFNKMIRRKLISVSPLPRFSDFNLARPPSKKSLALSGGQVSALLKACGDDDQLGLWIGVMLMTGARPGEAAALRWSDIDGDVVTIAGSVKPVRGADSRRGQTKSRKDRTVPVAPRLADALAIERGRQEAVLRSVLGEAEPLKPMLDPDDFIFPADLALNRSAPRSMASWSSRFKQACKLAALPPWISPHKLRHTFATVGLTAGVSIIDIASALGHTNPMLTARVYAHPVEEGKRRAVSIAADMITAQPSDNVEQLVNSAARK